MLAAMLIANRCRIEHLATLPLPHGELVEPRPMLLQPSILKKILPTYPTPSHLAYSDGVLSGGNAPETF
ncbi:hypothetical protein SAMN05443582_103128 [Phyllobacterium sp. OV277]|nr:hypothetical protein SAMN05443582_103128 [Phyllobacterium sp. OV277]